MSREITTEQELAPISFDRLGGVIAMYKTAADAYSEAQFVNLAYDKLGFSTLKGQDLENWKKEFLRTENETMEELEEHHHNAQEMLIETLGLESAEIIDGLISAFGQEELRRECRQTEEEKNRLSDWSKGVPVHGHVANPRDFVKGVLITMAQLTGESYTVHDGMIASSTYYIGYVTAEPTSEIETVFAELRELGLTSV